MCLSFATRGCRRAIVEMCLSFATRGCRRAIVEMCPSVEAGGKRGRGMRIGDRKSQEDSACSRRCETGMMGFAGSRATMIGQVHWRRGARGVFAECLLPVAGSLCSTLSRSHAGFDWSTSPFFGRGRHVGCANAGTAGGGAAVADGEVSLAVDRRPDLFGGAGRTAAPFHRLVPSVWCCTILQVPSHQHGRRQTDS